MHLDDVGDAQAGRALRRPAPARHDRAGARQRPGDRLGRRADRRPRQRERQARSWTCCSSLNREHNQTFVLVTHDHGIAARTQRIIRMQDGADHQRRTRDGPRAAQVRARTSHGFALRPLDEHDHDRACSCCSCVTLGLSLLMFLRNRIIFMIGLRNIPRRMAQTVLIVDRPDAEHGHHHRGLHHRRHRRLQHHEADVRPARPRRHRSWTARSRTRPGRRRHARTQHLRPDIRRFLQAADDAQLPDVDGYTGLLVGAGAGRSTRGRT